MSMYLFDEQPILANKALARELGLNEALVMQQINYWINSVGSREKLEEYQGKSLSQIRSDLHDDVKNSKMIQQMKRKIMSWMRMID